MSLGTGIASGFKVLPVTLVNVTLARVMFGDDDGDLDDDEVVGVVEDVRQSPVCFRPSPNASLIRIQSPTE